jgi:hypothetical protein
VFLFVLAVGGDCPPVSVVNDPGSQLCNCNSVKRTTAPITQSYALSTFYFTWSLKRVIVVLFSPTAPAVQAGTDTSGVKQPRTKQQQRNNVMESRIICTLHQMLLT